MERPLQVGCVTLRRPSRMEPLDDSDNRFKQLLLELTMREVLGGMYELSLEVAYAHLDFALEILPEEPVAATEAPTAEIIPFPRLRRAVGE